MLVKMTDQTQKVNSPSAENAGPKHVTILRSLQAPNLCQAVFSDFRTGSFRRLKKPVPLYMQLPWQRQKPNRKLPFPIISDMQ